MLTRLFNDAVVYGLGRYLSALVGLALVPLYTRLIPPEQYGAMEIFSTLTASLGIFAVLGMDSAFALFYYDETEPAERARLASTALLIRLVLAVTLAGGLFVLLSPLEAFLLGSSEYTTLLKVTLGVFSFQMLQGFVLDYLRLRRQPWRFSMVSILGVLIAIGLGLFLVVGLRQGVAGVVVANAIAAVISALLGLVLVRDGLSFAFSFQSAKKMLAYGLPLVPASIASWIVALGDRYFMAQSLSLAQIGIYAIALKVASVVALATSSFQLAWGPFAFSIKDHPNARETYARVLLLFLGAGVSGAVLLGLFAPEILALALPSQYAEASAVTGILVLVPVLVGVYYIVSLGVSLTAKTAYISLTTGLAAVVSLGMNFLLIPRWGIAGAAVTALCGQMVSVVALYGVSQRFYLIPFDAPRAIALFVLGLGALGLGAYLPPVLPQLLVKLVILVGYLLTAFMLLRGANAFELSRFWKRVDLRLLGKDGG